MWYVRWQFKFRHLVSCGGRGTVTLVLIACSLHSLVQTSCRVVISFRKQPGLWKIKLFSFCLTYCRRTEQTQQQVQALWSVLVSDYCYNVLCFFTPTTLLAKMRIWWQGNLTLPRPQKDRKIKNSCVLQATQKACKENLLEWVKWKFDAWKLPHIHLT